MKDIEKEIDDILTRGVGSFIDPQGEFRKKLLKKAKGEYSGEIIIKFGIDPTRPDIHLGHAVVLRKLRQLQDLGCKVIFLVGDFTTQIGDPTGKSKLRPELDQKEIEANVNTFIAQIGGALSLDPAVFSWIRNSDWFYTVSDLILEDGSFENKAKVFWDTRMQNTHLHKNWAFNVTFLDVLRTLRQVTHAQLIERDMFQERLKKGGALYMHEMLYPVLQGIDSKIICQIYGGCDLEIGGTDQTFNMLMGREVMKMNNQPEQAVMSLEILVGTDGKEKMSKSLDNYISITDDPKNMFGKIMSIPDKAIVNYYELCTTEPEEKIKEIKDKLGNKKNIIERILSIIKRETTTSGINPRDIKRDLAEKIVSLYHGHEKAVLAKEAFASTFQKKEIPEEVDEIKADEGELLVDALLKAKIVSSKTDFRHLVEEGAIKLLSEEEGEKISDLKAGAIPGVYKIGKKRFVKITTQ